MKERQILFSAPMVHALLAGTKTQTRRAVKPQPPHGHFFHGVCICSTHRNDEGKAVWAADESSPFLRNPHRVRSPYGQPGDRLWVRETFQYRGASYDGHGIDESEWFRCYGAGGAADNWDPDYPHGWWPTPHMNVKKLDAADEQEGEGVTGWVTKRIPGIHMPRWASRITLEVISVRVERLQDISEADAAAEGVHTDPACPAYGAYQALWEQINGKGSWDANPWVWVIDFRRAAQEGGAA